MDTTFWREVDSERGQGWGFGMTVPEKRALLPDDVAKRDCMGRGCGAVYRRSEPAVRVLLAASRTGVLVRGVAVAGTLEGFGEFGTIVLDGGGAALQSAPAGASFQASLDGS